MFCPAELLLAAVSVSAPPPRPSFSSDTAATAAQKAATAPSRVINPSTATQHPAASHQCRDLNPQFAEQQIIAISASKSSIQRFVITEKAPTRGQHTFSIVS